MARNRCETLAEVQDELEAMVAISWKFQGFEIKPNLKWDIDRAASLVEEGGKDREAMEVFKDVIRGIRNTLRGFLKGSPKFFADKLENLRAQFAQVGGLDQDIEARVRKVLIEEARVVGGQLEIDFNLAADAYTAALTAIQEAASAQQERIKNRQRLALQQAEERLAADLKHAEEQRLLEAARRRRRADEIRALLHEPVPIIN